jgi:putative SOS response-associated peptidase YedK
MIANEMAMLRYFEWLKKGKDKLPYFTRNKGGAKLMLLAGLYDCVTLEGIKRCQSVICIELTWRCRGDGASMDVHHRHH